MTQTPEQIAAGLTAAQSNAIRAGWGSVGVARRLKAKGLSSGSFGSDPNWVAIVETTLGDRVKIILQAQVNTNAE